MGRIDWSWPLVRSIIGAVMIHTALGRYQCASNFAPYVLSYYKERHGADVTRADGLAMFSLQIVGKAVSVTAIVWSCDGFFNRVGQKWRALLGGVVVSFAIFLGWLSMIISSSYMVREIKNR